MKLIILRDKLKNGLNIVERISGKSLTLPVLSSVLLSTEKNFLNLTTTDLEIGVNWWVLAKTEKEGKILLPAKVLSSFLSLLPNKPLFLEEKNQILFIGCENYQTQIKGASPEDFPLIPPTPKEDFIELPAELFCQSLSQVVDIALFSQARPEISGVYFAFQKDLIKMVATDSFRLGEKKLFFDRTKALSLTTEKEISFILPQKTAREIINIFSEEKELKIYFSPNQVLFESLMEETSHPKIQMTSRLIEGEYPNYQEIIPKKFETQIILDRNEFLNQIKTASLFSGRINEVKIKVDPKRGGLTLFSQNPDLGEHQSFLPAKIKGEGLEIAFNWRFLIDGLLNIKSPEIVFELNGEEGPGVLKPGADPSYIYLVMPIKAS